MLLSLLILDVPNVYPFLPLFNNLDSGSKNIIKKYDLECLLVLYPALLVFFVSYQSILQ